MRRLIILGIKIYQRFLSPFLPWSCRFYPSCSQYALEAVKEFGLFKGLGKGMIRILKCQPLHPGGHDPVLK
ncbi:MAG TPA: membrane protein insertion efficiency factor YidD [Nitrospiria bacterium]|nr:membrane protein insertion efficiency factor YidD [Nitrospiria bacterium]